MHVQPTGNYIVTFLADKTPHLMDVVRHEGVIYRYNPVAMNGSYDFDLPFGRFGRFEKRFEESHNNKFQYLRAPGK